MKLPNFDNAIIQKEKLTKYCLNELHPIGKYKARLFKSILQITIANYQDLITLIKNGLQHTVAKERKSDMYGRRYSVDIKVLKNTEVITIRTNWIIKNKENIPTLTSCFIKL